MCNHWSLFLKAGIPVYVIEVIVGVDDEAHRFVGQFFERGFDPIGQRRELIIDQDDAIVADREPDVAARALEHVNIAGNLADLDFYFVEVILGHQ